MARLDVPEQSCFFDEGSVLFFRDSNGNIYDGVVWKVIPEGASSTSVFIRFIDRLLGGDFFE